MLRTNNVKIENDLFFDTLKIRPTDITDFKVRCALQKINVRQFEDGQHVGISIDETVTNKDLSDILSLFGVEKSKVSFEGKSWNIVFFEESVGKKGFVKF